MVDAYYPATYSDARANFLSACLDTGLSVRSYRNPETGPDGESLYCDATLIGPRDAAGAIVATSATHGVEGFAGSGIQVGLMRNAAAPKPGPGVALLLVHTINPHGMAWLRRENEDNVDLNRNFIDHSVARARNVEYDGLHDALVPKKWNDKTIARCDAKFEDFIRKHSEMALQGAVTRGQYHHADGLFYGGIEATWSRRTFIDIVERYVAGASDVCFLDFHTGLGRYGAAELIGGGERARDWFGDGMPPPRTTSSSAPGLGGVIGSAVRKFASGANITSITVEFGTYPVREVLRALQADNWLHVHGEFDSKLGREIKADVRLRLYPDEDDWKEMVWVRARQIVRRALRGLGQ